MKGVPQSGADRCATAESHVKANWSNGYTVLDSTKIIDIPTLLSCPNFVVATSLGNQRNVDFGSFGFHHALFGRWDIIV